MPVSRRRFNVIPAQGTPKKLVHRVEPGTWTRCRSQTDVFSLAGTGGSTQGDACAFPAGVPGGRQTLSKKGLHNPLLDVFYDITWTGCVGQPSARQQEIFAIMKDARDLGVATVHSAVPAGRKIAGWEVDRVVRDFISRNGYGEHFIHRTGHSIGSSIHANGANMDDLDIKDECEIIPNTCFSVEPGGIYMPEFGVRSEVNVLVRSGSAEVTGRIRTELVII